MARLRVSSKVCPPGVLCLSPLTGFFGILVMILFIGFIAYILQSKGAQIQAPLPLETRISNRPVHVTQVNEGGDDRYTRAPEPQRFWNNGPEIPPRGALLPPDGGMLINVPTQGLPERYQQMGILKKASGEILPLYGRRIAARSDRYNYYTRTDTYNPVQLPIRYKNRDCQNNDSGCEELFSGEHVHIIPTGETATTTLYRFDGPMYVPSII